MPPTARHLLERHDGLHRHRRNPNSATGVGPVTVNNGGILGGSSAGGAVGMPSSGSVTINSGGTLVPAGLTWTTAAAPTFNVLGDLTLNAGSTVDFAFDPTNQDSIAVGGALTLPTSGSVTINVNDLGGLYNNIADLYVRQPDQHLQSVLPCGCRRFRRRSLFVSPIGNKSTCWRRGREA